eukprot:1148686-Pelagomonas_calceolata.AAC.7
MCVLAAMSFACSLANYFTSDQPRAALVANPALLRITVCKATPTPRTSTSSIKACHAPWYVMCVNFFAIHEAR